jgi:hypothetical protein
MHAQELDQLQQPADLRAFVRTRKKQIRIEPVVIRHIETRGPPCAEQSHERVGHPAAAVKLHDQVKCLGPHRTMEGADAFAVRRLLRQTGPAGKCAKAVQVSGVPRGKGARPGQADEDDFALRQRPAQGPKGGHRTQKVAQLQSAEDCHAPRQRPAGCSGQWARVEIAHNLRWRLRR